MPKAVISPNKLLELIQDELHASREYYEMGLYEFSRDEAKHGRHFIKLLKQIYPKTYARVKGLIRVEQMGHDK